MTNGNTRRQALRVVGAAGVAGLAGCIGGGGGEPDDTGGDNGDGGGGSGQTETVDADAVVTVGPGGDLVFDPAELAVEVGATVAWRWDSGGHTVTVDEQPQGSQWRGTNLSTKEEGYVLTQTFDVAGRYEYHCTPHGSSGMEGVLVVGDAATEDETATATGDGTTTATETGDETLTASGDDTATADGETATDGESTPQQY